MRTAPTNLAQGQAGVYTVAAQLLLRGLNPCMPSVDIGADLILDCGVKIQVKSSRLKYYGAYKQGAYWFKLTWRITLSNGRVVKHTRMFSEEADFVVLWGVDTSRFWIVPSAVLDGHQLVVVGPDSQWVDVDSDAVAQMRNTGKTFRQISDETGHSIGTLHRSMNGRRATESQSLTNAVRGYENRWDLIQGCANTLTQANTTIVTEEVALRR